MARNPVQSINEFLSLYGTEQQFRRPVPMALAQRFRVPELTTEAQSKCYRCNRQTSITAGTIFPGSTS